MESVLELIAQQLETISAGDPDQIYSKRKAITALLPYAFLQAQAGQHRVLDVCLHAARASKWAGFLWYHIQRFPVASLLNEESPVSIKQAFILISPHLSWPRRMDECWAQQWVAAASAVSYTDEIGQSVVDTLLQIASNSSLQPYIPVDMWSWLRTSPPLPPISAGRYRGNSQVVFQVVQSLGDIETLTAYLLLIWSEWETLKITNEVHALIREDFSGIGMGYHRKQLLQHLDHVLGELELGLGHLQQHNPHISEWKIQQRQGQYRELKEALLEVDRKAIELLVCKSSRLVISFGLLNLCVQVKDPTQCLCVQSLLYLYSSMSRTFPMTSPAL